MFTLPVRGQIRQPGAPTFNTPQPISPTQSYQGPIQNNQKTTGPNVYENQVKRQKAQQQMIRDIYKEIEADASEPAIQYDLPSYSHIAGTAHYRTAFSELQAMEGQSLSIKRANFLVENAFYANEGDYENFDNLIREIGQFLRMKMKELGMNQQSNLAKNLMLFRFFADTLKIASKGLEHLPFVYDFEDYMGYDDWTNMFVEKLLRTNAGQCHSLPVLYLILAEEIGAVAHLAFSPNHTYIKFQDDNGAWHNIELTNGMLTTDAFIMQSGYIKAEALQNEIYMQPLTERQLLSHMMMDLAKGYAVKYGYDQFVEQVTNKAIELFPNNIFAQMVKSDYRTLRFQYVVQQLGLNQENLRYYPKAVELYKQQNEQYDLVDNLGYEDMPLEAYEKWLGSLQEARQKQESRQLMQQLNEKLELRETLELRK